MTALQTPPNPAETVAQPRPAIATAGAALTWTRRKYRTGEVVPRSQQVIAYSILVLGSIAFLIPFYFVVNGSLKTDAAVQAGDFVRPVFAQLVPPPGTRVSLDDLEVAARVALGNIAGPLNSTVAIYKQSTAADQSGDPSKTLAYIVRLIVNGKLHELRIQRDASIASNVELQSGAQWGNYVNALGVRKMNFRPALANTVVITVLCVIGQVISCSLVGFGFARFKFRGRSILFIIMLSTMMLPTQVTMIPVFVLFRTLGMIDSFWPLVLPAWLASPFFVFMFRQFFAQIPEELIEAARIDGASNWRVYWQLMLPLSGPVIAIVAIYTFLGSWNDFLGPLIYLNSPENRTLALALNSFKGQYGTTDVNLLMAASVVCMLPCVILFFSLQKYFVESVAMTGLKS